jgi:hypothetical protein
MNIEKQYAMHTHAASLPRPPDDDRVHQCIRQDQCEEQGDCEEAPHGVGEEGRLLALDVCQAEEHAAHGAVEAPVGGWVEVVGGG